PRRSSDLLERARRGDADAHAALFRAYGGAVMTLARRLLGKRDVAEEILQETFLEVWRKMDAYRGDAPFGFWLRSIAINRCLMSLRARREWQELPDEEMAGDLGDLSSALARADLETLLDCLPPMGRTVLWLHEVEGYTHPEIANLLGRTASFSKSQLARAHARMRTLVAAEAGLREEVMTCTPKSAG